MWDSVDFTRLHSLSTCLQLVCFSVMRRNCGPLHLRTGSQSAEASSLMSFAKHTRPGQTQCHKSLMAAEDVEVPPTSEQRELDPRRS